MSLSSCLPLKTILVSWPPFDETTERPRGINASTKWVLFRRRSCFNSFSRRRGAGSIRRRGHRLGGGGFRFTLRRGIRLRRSISSRGCPSPLSLFWQAELTWASLLRPFWALSKDLWLHIIVNLENRTSPSEKLVIHTSQRVLLWN